MIQPTEIRSTPVAAIAGAVCAVTRPDAAVIARTPAIATASVSCSWDMLPSAPHRHLPCERQFQMRDRVDLDLNLHHMVRPFVDCGPISCQTLSDCLLWTPTLGR